MSAIFQIFRQNNIYSFNFFNNLGQPLMIGGKFDNLHDTEKAVEEVRTGSCVNQQIATIKTSSGNAFFIINDSTGEKIANSRLFDNQIKLDAALLYIKNKAPFAELVKPV